MSKKHAVHHSSISVEYATPVDFFKKYDNKYHFTLDPCATKENAKCKLYYTKKQNGLIQDWKFHIVWMNPPYGRTIGNWMCKAYVSAKRKGALVVCLVPSRTDTEWWHTYVMQGEIEFIKGRLKFGNAKNAAPFPSAIVVFRPGIPCRLPKK